MGEDTLAESITFKQIHQLCKQQLKSGIALNQVRSMLGVVQLVYRWGRRASLLPKEVVTNYRMKKGKDDPEPLQPSEYTDDEFARLLGAVNRHDAQQWRAWVFLVLGGCYGQRANAILNLRWSDIDFDAKTITWPKRYQKQGTALVRPLLPDAIEALQVAREQRERALRRRVRKHHKSPRVGAEALDDADWVLFAERDKSKPFSYSSLAYHITEAEKRAGVEHQLYRLSHGVRRMVVGSVGELSGDRALGLEWVGDSDLRMLRSYDKRGPGRIETAAAKIESVRKVSGNENADPDGSASA